MPAALGWQMLSQFIVWTVDFRCGQFLKHTFGLWEIHKDIDGLLLCMSMTYDIMIMIIIRYLYP